MEKSTLNKNAALNPGGDMQPEVAEMGTGILIGLIIMGIFILILVSIFSGGKKRE